MSQSTKSPKKPTLKPETLKRARALIVEGMKKVQTKLQLAEEYGITPRTAQVYYDKAREECLVLATLRAEQVRVAEAMHIGGYRQSRITAALLENWGAGANNEGAETLDEETADLVVQMACDRVAEESPKTKEDKRTWMSLWFEDKMMNAGKDRDQIRAAALLMRLEGLADTTEYEAPTDDIVIELGGDWREEYQEKLEKGEAPTASTPPSPAPVPANGTKPTNGTAP